MEIALPEVAVQKRIVSILDEAFSAIAKAKENAEKNLLSARELFESYLNRVFTQQGLDWQEPEIQEHIKFIDYRGKTPPKIESGMRLITAKNVKKGFLQLKPQEFVSPDIYDEWMTRGIPKKGDVLFTTEAPLGNVAQLDTAEKVVFAQRVIIMQPDAAKIDSTFLKFALLSSVMQQRIQDKGTGATAKGIKSKLLKKVPIPFPNSLKEQRHHVEVFASFWAARNQLETIYTHKLANLDELKQSLLQKAFTGQLTKGNGVPVSSTLPFPVSIGGISKTDLHAGVLGLAFLKHELPKTSHFGHVKGEKIAHLVESLVGIDLGRSPIKDAAGPNDFQHLKKVESRAKKAGFFEVTRQEDRYFLKPKDNFEGLLEKTKSCLGKRMAKVEELLSVMAPMTTRQAEIFATTFAAWNNLLVLGRPTDDDSIVLEAREDWHPKKLKIDRAKFLRSIGWIRDHGFEPQGIGKVVGEKPEKKSRGSK